MAFAGFIALTKGTESPRIAYCGMGVPLQVRLAASRHVAFPRNAMRGLSAADTGYCSATTKEYIPV
jgi:hypothetical protein